MPIQYTTPANTPLTVSAGGGVLVGYPVGSTCAVGTAPPAGQATVSLSSGGGFTFTPAATFLGMTNFSFVPTVGGFALSPVVVRVMVGDVVAWAHQRTGADGAKGVDGTGTYQSQWQVRAYAPWTTAAEILASGKLPQRGDALYRYRQQTGTPAGRSPFAKSYVRDVLVSDDQRVVNHTCRQDANDPRMWDVTVHYAGVDDPTALLAEVQSQDSEYQEYQSYDVYGRVVLNSAFDPVAGGIPVDRATKSITIVRNLPWEAWDMDRGEPYRNTLNIEPFVLSQQVGAGGGPVLMPPGSVRLKKVTEQRMVRSQTSSATTARFYWRVTAELVIDRRTFRREVGAAEEERLHRWVIADTGFNEIRNGVKTPLTLPGVSRPTEPQLLKNGLRIGTPGNSFPPLVWSTWENQPATQPDFYTTLMNTPLTVPNPGVLANDSNGADAAAISAAMDPAQGTVALNPGGGFTFTPATSFVGYATFTYTASVTGGGGLGPSLPTTVVITVGAVPTLLVYDRYEYAEWSPDLDALLLDW